VRLDGEALPKPQRHLYYILNKPLGYTSTKRDPHASLTVTELLGDLGSRVYPVGRLDVDSSGLLLLSNDGDFAFQLTHPRHKVPKTYHVVVRGAMDPMAVRQLSTGIDLVDGRTAPAEVKVLATLPGGYGQPAKTEVEIVLREGKKRQVRRMCAAAGFPVLELTRVSMGPLTLGRLKTGKWRALTGEEVTALLRCAGGAGQEPTAKPPGEARQAGAKAKPKPRPRQGVPRARRAR
jgi:pseudouridine synthase